MTDMLWLIGIWLYFGAAHCIYISVYAERPLPDGAESPWVWLGVALMGPWGWCLTIRTAIVQMLAAHER